MTLEQNVSPMKIGYVPVTLRSSAAFPEPRILRGARQLPVGRRAAQACPAVNDFERKVIEVLSPFSLGMRIQKNRKGGFDLHLVDEYTRIDEDLIGAFVTLMPRETWRVATSPVVQIGLPYFFVTDHACFLTQMPAWASADQIVYPGQFIGGRFPAHIWPRTLNLSFEWAKFDSVFRMKRGQPACYLYVESDLEQAVALVPAKSTEALNEYRARIEDVVKFTSQSFGLIDELKKFRPAQLLTEI